MKKMSRFTQIRIILKAIYKPDLRAHFPKVARALEELGIEFDAQSVTLYHLIGKLEQALYGEMRPGLRTVLERHRPQLLALHGKVEEKLAAWKLDGLDELLYRMEDAFQDLEGDLD
jgi:hypothetical protein